MWTRRGACYSHQAAAAAGEGPEAHRRKRLRTAAKEWPAAFGSPAGCAGRGDMFDELPDDLVVSILAAVAASAGSPADLVGVMLTGRRFRELGQSKVVLARASPRCLAVPAKAWSDDAHRFLQRCADAGNLEACYLLGMIRFYCLGNRGSGAALLAAAAARGHRDALYSLAVIQFNGSGGRKDDRDLRAGAALCARAAALGHVDALRELGHCLQDGYGVRRSVPDGRRLLVHANARELASAAGSGAAANRFLVDWFASRPLLAGASKTTGSGHDDGGEGGGLRLCSQTLCGRRETRRHEFRRCSVCGAVNYCSRACQARHWKTAHKAECAPMDRWLRLDVAAPAP